jgi:hypothetical protein
MADRGLPQYDDRPFLAAREMSSSACGTKGTLLSEYPRRAYVRVGSKNRISPQRPHLAQGGRSPIALHATVGRRSPAVVPARQAAFFSVPSRDSILRNVGPYFDGITNSCG